MFSLQKFFAKDDRLFDLLEAGAQACCESVQALKQMMRAPASDHSLDQFVAVRRKDKQINKEINELLARSSVTSLDPEDIESIARTLYKIPKTVQKIAERIMICPRDIVKDQTLHDQIRFLEQATEIVMKMVRLLRSGASLVAVVDLDARLQYIEGEADKLVTRMLQELYQGQREAKEVIILKDVFELLERAIDRCRDAGSTIFQIVLKIS